MFVASCRVTLYLSEGRSLKEKRRVTKSLLGRLRSRHNVSASEVDAQDLWQKAVLGVALAAPTRRDAETRMDRVLRDVDEHAGVKYVEFEQDCGVPAFPS